MPRPIITTCSGAALAALLLFITSPSTCCRAADEYAPLLPTSMRPEGPWPYTERSDEVYGSPEGIDLHLDLALPQGDGPFPGIVVIHGGAWRGGDRKAHRDLTQLFASYGYVACTVQYRLCPTHLFPAQIHDVKCAVRWLRSHAGELRLDPERIGAIGLSAGAHLAMLLGLTGPEDGLDGDCGDPAVSARVKAVVSFAGPTDLAAPDLPEASVVLVRDFLGGAADEKPDLYRAASPIHHVSAGDASMLLLQGTRDPLVPHTQALAMVDRLTEAGVPARIEILVGASHGWGGTELIRTLRGAVEFFHQQLSFANQI